MTLYKKSTEELALFYDYIREYEKKKATNEKVECFGIMGFWLERYFMESIAMFKSQRMQHEEETEFEGDIYVDLTDVFNGLIQTLSTLKTNKEKMEAVEEETKTILFPDLYAVTSYCSLKNQYHRHDIIASSELLSLNSIEAFFIGTGKEFYQYLDEEYGKIIQYSPNYVLCEVIEKELEVAEKREPIYTFTQDKFRHLENYEEKAYYLPALDNYYVKGSGDYYPTIMLEDDDETSWDGGFSRFTEDEFAAFLIARFKNGDLKGFETIQEVPEIQQIYKKYRLKWLFEEN